MTIDEQSENVRFVHYTTQEFLQRNQEALLPDAKIEITRSCTAYLSIDGLAVGPCLSQVNYGNRLKEFVLLEYAAVHWGLHLNSLTGTDCVAAWSEITTEAQSLLLDDKRVSSMSQVLFMSKWRLLMPGAMIEEGERFFASHWIGRFGLVPLLEQWIDKKYDIDQPDFSRRTPLSWAARDGHDAVVKQLLDTGKVDVDSKDNFGRTPRSIAAKNRNEAIVKLLLDTGKLGVDSNDIDGQTSPSRAAVNGHQAIVN